MASRLALTHRFGQQILEQTEHRHCGIVTDLTFNTGSVNTAQSCHSRRDSINTLVKGLAAAVISGVGSFLLRSLRPTEKTQLHYFVYLTICKCTNAVKYSS